MKRYNPSEIEPKWQHIWSEDQRYKAPDSSDKPKYYVTGMFPYPSGAGMHTGHFFEHSIVDGVARFQRALGRNVMYPMGFDNFGLPAENYAIKTGVSPQVATRDNIANFKNQLNRVGASIDWSREVQTSDPGYYKWTQWIFTKLFERGLAYQKEAQQWWCEIDQTVLANEQVVNGKCWRHDGPNDPPAIKKSIKQWFFKITDYADALLEEIPALDWPEKIKTAQTNWIGKSQGAEITFQIENTDDEITVFSTRPDTIFGATFVVLAPEHPLAKKLATDETRQAVESYIDDAIKKSEIERQSEGKEKTGVFTGSYAINPASGDKVPIWIADYVLGGYGTGAVMAVPAHDERDFEFASKFKLRIIKVVQPMSTNDLKAIDIDRETGRIIPGDGISYREDEDPNEVVKTRDYLVYQGEGNLLNSGSFDGMSSSDAREEIVAWLEQQGLGKSKVTYKMRDWLISRQRYWGAPIPIIHCPEHGAVAVPESDLSVLLPDIEDYAPKGDGKSPLARADDWVNTTCPECGGPAKRETDVMDGYACSSWYLLRYTDPHDDQQAWKPELANYWTPLDMYVGGDHAVAHLLYVRFWNHVFYDMKLVPTKEPIKKLVYHGLIQAEDGTKMSKSKGNVVDPLEVIDAGYGADALRTFELFLGPINENSNWSSKGIAGVYRFLNRLWTLVQEYQDAIAASPSESSETASPRRASAAEFSLEAAELASLKQSSLRQEASPSDARVPADVSDNSMASDSTVEVRKLESLTHATIKKVTADMNRLSFNTAIAALMEFVNELYKLKTSGFSKDWQSTLEALVQMVQPMAPHMAAELWQQLGHDDQLDFVPWPGYDEAKIITDTITIVVQVNGKVRTKLEVSPDISAEDVKQKALNGENVQKFMANKKPAKVIYIPSRLVNIVT